MVNVEGIINFWEGYDGREPKNVHENMKSIHDYFKKVNWSKRKT